MLSKEDYGGIVSEPYDIIASKNNNFLIIANGRLNILIVDTTDFKATRLISVWDNKYKRYIYDIYLTNSDLYIFVSVFNKGLIVIDI